MLGAKNGEAGGRQACASCKHQRKKCSEETCVLYPYFPTEKTEDFKIVHKYFGVGNICKNIKSLAVEDRERAVVSYVWAGRAWNQNPSTGPLGLYMDLRQENQQLKQEIQELKSVTNYGASAQKYGNSSIFDNYRALVGPSTIEDVRKIQETTHGVNAENFGTGSSVNGNYNAPVGGTIEEATKIQELKPATNYGVNAKEFGIDSSVNGSYSALIGAPIEDFANFEPIPSNRFGERDVVYTPYGIFRAQRPDHYGSFY